MFSLLHSLHFYTITAITCPSLTTPSNGNAPSCTDSDNYDSICTFTCLTGFGIVGSATSTCTGDGSSDIGSYDNPAPTCEGKYCNDNSSDNICQT